MSDVDKANLLPTVIPIWTAGPNQTGAQTTTAPEGAAFPSDTVLHAIRDRGAIPFIRFKPVSWNLCSCGVKYVDPDWNLDSYANGDHDAFLYQYGWDMGEWMDGCNATASVVSQKGSKKRGEVVVYFGAEVDSGAKGYMPYKANTTFKIGSTTYTKRNHAWGWFPWHDSMGKPIGSDQPHPTNPELHGDALKAFSKTEYNSETGVYGGNMQNCTCGEVFTALGECSMSASDANKQQFGCYDEGGDEWGKHTHNRYGLGNDAVSYKNAFIQWRKKIRDGIAGYAANKKYGPDYTKHLKNQFKTLMHFADGGKYQARKDLAAANVYTLWEARDPNQYVSNNSYVDIYGTSIYESARADGSARDSIVSSWNADSLYPLCDYALDNYNEMPIWVVEWGVAGTKHKDYTGTQAQWEEERGRWMKQTLSALENWGVAPVNNDRYKQVKCLMYWNTLGYQLDGDVYGAGDDKDSKAVFGRYVTDPNYQPNDNTIPEMFHIDGLDPAPATNT